MTLTTWRNAGLVLIVIATTVGLLVLRDATKYEGAVGSEGSTHVEFAVDTRRYPHDREHAAAALWYSCIGEVPWGEMTAPAESARGTYVAALRPALATDSQRRFQGCLQDTKLDRVRGTVVAITTEPGP